MVVSFILSILISFIIYFATGSFSTYIMAILSIVIGSFFSFLIDKNNRQKGLQLFYIVFSFYALFALFHYLGYHNNYSFFTNEVKDEFYYFSLTQTYQHVSLSTIFNDCFVDNVFYENQGYIFYISSISSLATLLFDGNHLLCQFLGTTLVGSLISILLFRLFIIYINQNKSYKYALIFSLCSVFSYYSIVLLRDIFIAFFYIWGFVIILNRFHYKGLLGLFILFFLIWLFRIEHGLFFIIFILYYIYNRFKKYKLFFLVGAIFIIILSSAFIFENFNIISSSLLRYREYSEAAVLSKDDSIGKIIWLWPTPIKEIAQLLNSQLQPFPSWIDLKNANNFFDGMVSLLPILYGFFWYTIIFSLVKWIVFKKKYKYFSQELITLSIIIVIFLFANTFNMNIRRIMCVYPFIFLLYVIIQEKALSKIDKKNTFSYSSITYILLILIYLIVKHV